MSAAKRLGAFTVAALSVALFAQPALAAHSVYVTNAGSNNVSGYGIGSGGALSPLTGSPFATGNGPEGLVVTPDGAHAYVTDAGASKAISEFAVGAGGALTPIGSLPLATPPTLLAMTPDGRHLYVSSQGGSDVYAFTVNADGTLTPVTGSPYTTGGSTPTAIVVTPDGQHLYVSNETSGTMAAFSIASNGSLTTVAGSPFTVGSALTGMALTPDGRYLYVGTHTSSSGVAGLAIASNGSLTPLSGSPFGFGGTTPGGVAITPDGSHLYITSFDSSNNVWGFTIASSGSLTAVAGSPFSTGGVAPTDVDATPDSRYLYATNTGSGTVAGLAIGAGGGLSAVSGSPFTSGTQPIWVVVSPDQGPVAAFSATGARAGSPSAFDGSASHDSDGTVVRYDWSFGDGTTAPNAGAKPTHVYAKAGTYTVTLTVTDDAGCSTRETWTGQTASCNGGPQASASQQIVISSANAPGVKITSAKINSAGHRAKFSFKSLGKASSLQCALVKRTKRHSHAKPHFAKCRSPKTYRHLAPGNYTFEVRAVLGSSRGSASIRSFTIAAPTRGDDGGHDAPGGDTGASSAADAGANAGLPATAGAGAARQRLWPYS